jgi:hypothetical protein
MAMISVLNNFVEYPGLRYNSLSDNSGEDFYHEVLNKAFYEALTNGDKLTVDLDGVGGYASSFLDEAFGNLVFDFGLKNVLQFIEIISEDEPHWKDMITKETFKEWEERRRRNQLPKVTKQHDAWYRWDGNKIEPNVWLTPQAQA